MTTRAGVFSSGDVVHGPATVVLAMKESKKGCRRHCSIRRCQKAA
ncbi:hypothetical protein EVA_11337 [gut metagenome]|uniref:Uncharacterized protein n=1 Tax=gut metagenome TaxID=749906 RepID=J9GLF2_9ZZZZ